MNKNAIGISWEEAEKELFTPEEIAASHARAKSGAAINGEEENQSVGLDEPEPNARGERVRLRKCKQCSVKRESPGFSRGECQ